MSTPKITIIQAENRPTLDYFLLSKDVNSRAAAQLGYTYKFLLIDEKYTKKYHPATCKIFTLGGFGPWDQYYYDYYILQNTHYFYIYKPEVLNTPNGIGLRHNWPKKQQMYDDLNALLDASYIEKEVIFNIDESLDDRPYPNTDPIPDGFPYCLSN
jgi:hypothetical protein